MRRQHASDGGRSPAGIGPESGIADGADRTSTSVPALVDTKVLVYRFDPRFPRKQALANEFLRRGIIEDSIRVPHQAVVEFAAAVTRPLGNDPPLLSPDDARRRRRTS